MGNAISSGFCVAMNRKIHPIWWLVGFSVLIGLINHDWNGEQAVEPVTPAERQQVVANAIKEITDMDAHGDMSWQPQYEAAIISLDTNCSEPLSEVLELSYSEMQKRGEEGVQFALLNELEDTASMIAQSTQRPIQCDSLISASSY